MINHHSLLGLDFCNAFWWFLKCSTTEMILYIWSSLTMGGFGCQITYGNFNMMIDYARLVGTYLW